MKDKLTFFLSLALLFTMFFAIPNYTFANSESVEINADQSKVYMKYQNDSTFTILSNGEHTINNTSVNLDGSYSTRGFSAYANSLFFWLTLRDNERNPVTGIKVSRIEMIQNNTVVVRANDVESYSVQGEYRTNNLEVINRFQNPNGQNTVDVVLYLGSKEVARLRDYTVHVYEHPIVDRINPTRIGLYSPKFQISTTLLNVNEGQKTDVYLVDENGVRITKTDKIITDYYNSDEKSRRVDFAVSLVDQKYLKENKTYNYIVEVDGKTIESFDKYPFIIVNETIVNTIYHASMPDLEFKVTGTNLLKNDSYRIVISQEGKVTKELSASAKFNESEYREEIVLDLLPEYFENYGGMYNVKLYSADNRELMNFNFLVPIDDTSKEENDIVNPFEGFKVFEKKENVEPNKTWRITFNKAVDNNTINNGNTYVINKRTGQSVKVDYNLEKAGLVLAITPEINFISGETYTLIIDQRVKSKLGLNLNQPAALEFTVK